MKTDARRLAARWSRMVAMAIVMAAASGISVSLLQLAAGPAGAGEGPVVTLDQDCYQEDDSIIIRLVHPDIEEGPIEVMVESDTEKRPPEGLTLQGSNGIFTGMIPATSSDPVHGDGFLSVSEGDEIVVSYATPWGAVSDTAHVGDCPASGKPRDRAIDLGAEGGIDFETR